MTARKFWGVAFLLIAIAAVLTAIFLMVSDADAGKGPPPTNPVHEKACLNHNGQSTWYVEPALSAHLGHGDQACTQEEEPVEDPENPENPGDPTNPVSNNIFLPDMHTGCTDQGSIIGLMPFCD